MTERLKKIIYKNKEVLVLDYSDCKESGMIEVFLLARELVLKENRIVLVLSIFNNKTYVSPGFMRTLEKEIKDVDHLIAKNAITGISEVQRWILKGMNLWYKRQIHAFDSVDKAMDFLVA